MHRHTRSLSFWGRAGAGFALVLLALVTAREGSPARAQAEAMITVRGTLRVEQREPNPNWPGDAKVYPWPNQRIFLLAERTDDRTWRTCTETTSAGDGSYELRIPPTPACGIARGSREKCCTYWVVVRREKLGYFTAGQVYTDDPRTWYTLRASLSWLGHSIFGSDQPNEDRPVPVGHRFYGRAAVSARRGAPYGTPGLRPAPAGVRIAVRTAEREDCLEAGGVTNDSGYYYLDIRPEPGCMRASDRAPRCCQYTLSLAGTDVRIASGSGGSVLDELDSGLGEAINLGITIPDEALTAQEGEDACVFASAGGTLVMAKSRTQRDNEQPLCGFPIPNRVKVYGDRGFRLVVRRCFDTLRSRAQDPNFGLPLRSLLAALDQTDQENPATVTIRQDLSMILGGPAGETTSERVGDLTNALVRINPLQFDAFVGNFLGIKGPSDVCSVIVHELAHAADKISGMEPTFECMTPQGPLDAAEIKAMAVENAYERAGGNGWIPSYFIPGLPPRLIDLPVGATSHPQEYWPQYERNMICDPVSVP